MVPRLAAPVGQYPAACALTVSTLTVMLRRRNKVGLSRVPNLKGKVALVTGANGGIGKVATQIMAQRGAEVYVQRCE